MTAPTRAKTAASRTGTAGKKNSADKTGSQQTKQAATKQTATQKTATRRNSATKSKQDTKGRGRSAAAERAYSRREERRERSARETPERRPRGQRPSFEQQRQPRLLRLSAVRPAARQLQAKVATSRVPLVVAVMSVLGVGLVTSLSLSIATVGGSYRLQQSGAELTALNEQRELLLREVSNMDSTPALQRKAAELGMVPPDSPPAHLLVQPDGGVRVIGDPEAATAPEPAAPPAPPAAQPPASQPPAPHPEAPQVPDRQQVPDPQRQAVPIPAVEGR